MSSLESLLFEDNTELPADSDKLPAPVWDNTKFRAGRLSLELHLNFWEEVILKENPKKDYILENMQGMDPARYFGRFRGRFAGRFYDCSSPPSRHFRNNWPEGKTSTGEDPEDWAYAQILKDCETGAVECLGEVGVVDPPHIILPLSVELLKPRLIHDARFLNLWNTSVPFTMGRVASIPEVAPRGAYMYSIDHKSGYHAFSFVKQARGLFGFVIKGKYYQPAAGVFGWNRLPEIYHIAHEALVSFASKYFDIPSLVYLDDDFGCSLWEPHQDAASDNHLRHSARWAVRVVLWLNFLAGFTVSIKKSVLAPVRRLVWLGITIDSAKCEFSVPQLKKDSFLELVNSALDEGRVSIRDLERIAGKAISFMVAIGEAAMVYTRELFNILRKVREGKIHTMPSRRCRSAISIGISSRLCQVLQLWVKFLDVFDGAPWMEVAHSSIRIETDASSRRWGGVLREKGQTTLEVGEEFNEADLKLHIEAKEAIAVTRVIHAIAEVRGWGFLRGKRLDAYIDNLPLVFSMKKGASRMIEVHREIERLFWWKLEHKFYCSGIWWGTKENFRADDITRTEAADDNCLCRAVFLDLWRDWGRFEADLMASSVSAQHDLDNIRLPFFSRYYSPGCAGINLLAQSLAPGSYYCFPPANMIDTVVAFLAGSCASGTRVALVGGLGRCQWVARARGRVRDFRYLPGGSVKRFSGEVCLEGFGAWLLIF